MPAAFSPTADSVKPIVLYDGNCAFCAKSVQFILKHESDHDLLFAPRQSQIGQELLAQHGFGPAPGTMILIENGKAFGRSTATLRICRHLRWPWRAASSMLLIPAPLRDLGYRLVARYRHLWKSRDARCILISETTRTRFLADPATPSAITPK